MDRGTAADAVARPAERAVSEADRGLAEGATVAAARRRAERLAPDSAEMRRDLAEIERRAARRRRAEEAERARRLAEDAPVVRRAPRGDSADALSISGPAAGRLTVPPVLDTRLPTIDAEALLSQILAISRSAGRAGSLYRPVDHGKPVWYSDRIGVLPPARKGVPAALVLNLVKTEGMSASTPAGRREVFAFMIGTLIPRLSLADARRLVAEHGDTLPFEVKILPEIFDRWEVGTTFPGLIDRGAFDRIVRYVPPEFIDASLVRLFDIDYRPEPEPEQWPSAWKREPGAPRGSSEAARAGRVAMVAARLETALKKPGALRRPLVPGRAYPNGFIFVDYLGADRFQMWAAPDMTLYRVDEREQLLDAFREGVLRAAGAVSLAYAMIGAAATLATGGGGAILRFGSMLRGLNSAAAVVRFPATLARLALSNPKALAAEVTIDLSVTYAFSDKKIRSLDGFLSFLTSSEGIQSLAETLLFRAAGNFERPLVAPPTPAAAPNSVPSPAVPRLAAAPPGSAATPGALPAGGAARPRSRPPGGSGAMPSARPDTTPSARSDGGPVARPPSPRTGDPATDPAGRLRGPDGGEAPPGRASQEREAPPDFRTGASSRRGEQAKGSKGFEEAPHRDRGVGDRNAPSSDVRRPDRPRGRGAGEPTPKRPAPGRKADRADRATGSPANDNKPKSDPATHDRGGAVAADAARKRNWRKIDVEEIPGEALERYRRDWLSYDLGHLKTEDDYVRYRHAAENGWVKRGRELGPEVPPGGNFDIGPDEAKLLGQILGKKLGQKTKDESADEILKALNAHWRKAGATARDQVDLRAALEIADDKLRRAEVRRIFSNWRKRWNTRIKNDTALHEKLGKAGIEVSESGSLFVLYRDPAGKRHRLTLNLDHIERLADSPKRGLNPRNLRLVTPRENSVVLEALTRSNRDFGQVIDTQEVRGAVERFLRNLGESRD